MSEIEFEQRRSDGSLRHLLSLDGLSRAELDRLLNKAQAFVRPLGVPPPISDVLRGVTVANLFTEPSTRSVGWGRPTRQEFLGRTRSAIQMYHPELFPNVAPDQTGASTSSVRAETSCGMPVAYGRLAGGQIAATLS